MNFTTSLTFCGIAISIIALTACNTPPTLGPGEEAFGKAVRHNIAVQVVNPEPKPDTAAPSFDGSRSAIAIGRYKSDKVKPPREITTSDVGTGD
jgi:type IV pilus biogenesis protein CpaD/CtpE